MAKKLSKKQQIIETLIQLAYDKAMCYDAEQRKMINVKINLVTDILTDVFEMDRREVNDIYKDNYTIYCQMNRY